jgi:YD repeat-containing protein
MSARAAVVGRLVQVLAVQDVGRVRVGWDADWSEYRVQAWDASGRLVSEYHTDDRQDAIDTADVTLARMAGPTADQVAAVAAFATRHGRSWRAELAAAWLSGRDANEPDGHLLRQVRNRFGPRWLRDVTLAELGLR